MSIEPKPGVVDAMTETLEKTVAAVDAIADRLVRDDQRLSSLEQFQEDTIHDINELSEGEVMPAKEFRMALWTYLDKRFDRIESLLRIHRLPLPPEKP